MNSPIRPQVRSQSKTLQSMLSLQTNLFRMDFSQPRTFNQSAQGVPNSLAKGKGTFIKVRSSQGGFDSAPDSTQVKKGSSPSTCNMDVSKQKISDGHQVGRGCSAREKPVSTKGSVSLAVSPHPEDLQGDSKEMGPKAAFLVRKGSFSPTKRTASNSRGAGLHFKLDRSKSKLINTIHHMQSSNHIADTIRDGSQGMPAAQEVSSKRSKAQIKIKLDTRSSQASHYLPQLSTDSSPTNFRIIRANSSCSISLHNHPVQLHRDSISDADTQSISPKRLKSAASEQEAGLWEDPKCGAKELEEVHPAVCKLVGDQSRSLAEISLGNLNQNPHIQLNNNRVKNYLRELEGMRSQTRQLIQHSYLELTEVIRKCKEHSSPVPNRAQAALTQPTVGRRTKLLAFLVKKAYYKALGWNLLGKGPIQHPVIPSAVCGSPAGLLFLNSCRTGDHLKALAVLKSDKRLIFEYNHLQQTAYHICAKRGNSELLALISGVCKGDIDAKDITGRTALRWAYESRSFQCLKTLLAMGASPFGCRKRTDELVAKEQFEANMVLDEAIKRHVYIKYLGPYKKRIAFYASLTPLPNYL